MYLLIVVLGYTATVQAQVSSSHQNGGQSGEWQFLQNTKTFNNIKKVNFTKCQEI